MLVSHGFCAAHLVDDCICHCRRSRLVCQIAIAHDLDSRLGETKSCVMSTRHHHDTHSHTLFPTSGRRRSRSHQCADKDSHGMRPSARSCHGCHAVVNGAVWQRWRPCECTLCYKHHDSGRWRRWKWWLAAVTTFATGRLEHQLRCGWRLLLASATPATITATPH